MINRVKTILTDKDWEASILDGRLILRFSGEEITIDFKRRSTSLKFLEEIENLLRPTIFRLEEKEGDVQDYSRFLDELDTPPSYPPNNNRKLNT